MNKKYQLSLIIPAYNEENKIERDIREAFKFFRFHKINAEVIVSSCAISDQTNVIVKKLQKEFSHLKLETTEDNIGKGGVLKAGVKKASGKMIMFADAGLCVPYKFALDGIKKLSEGNDIALASRLFGTSKIVTPQPLYRRIGSKVFAQIAKKIITVPPEIKDTQCGFKMYKGSVAKKLYGQLVTTGFMFDIEIILRAKKADLKIAQFAVEWSNDADTKFKPISGALADTIELFQIKAVLKL